MSNQHCIDAVCNDQCKPQCMYKNCCFAWLLDRFDQGIRMRKRMRMGMGMGIGIGMGMGLGMRT